MCYCVTVCGWNYGPVTTMQLHMCHMAGATACCAQSASTKDASLTIGS